MDLKSGRYGEWAMVAGAADGIGSAFSSILAEGGMNLIMIDHNLSSMTSLADELEKKHGVRTVRIHKDLAEKDAAEECLAMINDLNFRLLIYVPAFSPVRRFMDHSPEAVERFLSLNVRSPLKMVHAFLRRQEKGKRAGIILMSSLAGMIGPALAAPYSATKAFSMILSESLFYELRENPVDVLACCAGPTSTPTYWSSKPAGVSKLVAVMEPDKVARYALKNLGKKPVCIPGWKNRLFYFILTRILPRRMAGRIVSDSMFKMYP
ncbi:MAG: SDR family NAD(P)-dependent oxidoreductase [Bacteroidetes bacterium]|nr:SDR family NAD(P)-dependent oxidoreductase [Bacteroidota bacterium]